jgi:hypothetical protein
MKCIKIFVWYSYGYIDAMDIGCLTSSAKKKRLFVNLLFDCLNTKNLNGILFNKPFDLIHFLSNTQNNTIKGMHIFFVIPYLDILSFIFEGSINIFIIFDSKY